ncbi:MAG: hypothetical protein WCK86_16650 [Planctomycetia bacterium]
MLRQSLSRDNVRQESLREFAQLVKTCAVLTVTVGCSFHSHSYVCRHPRTGSWQPEFFGSLIGSDHGLVLIFSRTL